MAHAIVEWTDNLEADGFDIRSFLSLIAAAFRNSDGVFPVGGVRVRGVRLTDYVIADGAAGDAFINITVKMGAGRSPEFKKKFFGHLFGVLSDALDPLFAMRYLALSLYIEEADEAASYKRNNIHKRYRAEV